MKDYLPNTIKLAAYYKSLGEKAMEQLDETALFWQPDKESNSIAIIVSHLAGNMLSRWTNFLSEDGEKSWRNRDQEFENQFQSKSELLNAWNKGWGCFLQSLSLLTEDDLSKIVYIRNEGHTVTDAIQRQMAHYPYHIGQIVFIAKMRATNPWKTLSVAKGNSAQYNQAKFATQKGTKHFTDEA